MYISITTEKYVIQAHNFSYRHFPFPHCRELVRRKNLLRKFKLWKKRKQRLWSIVVTERAKKEMIKEEDAKEQKR